MNATSVLFGTDHRLRVPWRIIIFLVVMVVAQILSAWIEMAAEGAASGLGYKLLVTEWSVPLGLLIATGVVLKAVEGRGWDFVGLNRDAASPQLLRTGLVYGLVAISIPAAILMLIGVLRPVPDGPGSWWAAAGISFANLLPAAFGEELLLRGYIFVVLREAFGSRWTLIVTSVVFGLLHIPNPGADAQSVAVVMLAGFFLGSIFLATRSLYAATAAHFIWNWFMAAGLHSPVSGIAVSTPDYRVIDAGPDWLTGGVWGPEGGLGAALGMFFVLVYIHARHRRRMES